MMKLKLLKLLTIVTISSLTLANSSWHYKLFEGGGPATPNSNPISPTREEQARNEQVPDSQRFGNYLFNSTYSDTCDNIEIESIVYTEAEFDTVIGDINASYSFSFEKFERYLATNDTSFVQTMFGEAAGKVWPFLLFTLVFLIILPFMAAYFCCNCRNVCRDRKYYKLNEHGKNAKDSKSGGFINKSKKTAIKYFTCFVILAVIATSIGTMVMIYGTSTAYEKTDCAVTYTFNDLIRGRKDKFWRFGGLKGLVFLFRQLKDEISLLTPNTVPVLNMDTQAANLKTNLADFFDN
jgi:hypothetical protein